MLLCCSSTTKKGVRPTPTYITSYLNIHVNKTLEPYCLTFCMYISQIILVFIHNKTSELPLDNFLCNYEWITFYVIMSASCWVFRTYLNLIVKPVLLLFHMLKGNSILLLPPSTKRILKYEP